jgi:hypothetical protein
MGYLWRHLPWSIRAGETIGVGSDPPLRFKAGLQARASSVKFARRLCLKPARDHDFGLRSGNARLRQRTDCSPRTVAAVRREVAPGAVGSEWGPAPGQDLGVQFAASQACGLMGTTSFSTITRHSRERQYCATSGVEVTHKFDTAGEVCATEAKRPGCRCHPTRSLQSHGQGRLGQTVCPSPLCRAHPVT